jgi:chromosomal replication initiation ATPase DnaA
MALQMSRATFTSWLQTSRAVALQDGILTVEVDSRLARDWIESRVGHRIQKTVDYFSNTPLVVRFVVAETATTPPRPNATRIRDISREHRSPPVAANRTHIASSRR